jgi:two-component system OmpR family response regulator
MPQAVNRYRPHILVVDDNEQILELLTQLLEDEGYRVSVSPRVLSVERVNAIDPDLIVQDLMFAGHQQAGWRFLEAARRDPRLARTPIILCTAAAGIVTTAETTAYLDRLAIPVVLKPFDLEQMLAAIQTALAARHLVLTSVATQGHGAGMAP